MAINVSQAFHRTSANPVDESMALTKAQMLTVNDNLMPAYYFTICQDDGEIYLYDKTAAPSSTTGKFTKFEGSSESVGHTILDSSGTAAAQESNLQFTGLSVTDDSVNGKTEVAGEGLNAESIDDIVKANSTVPAVIIGDANNYSTSEKVIGKWIDGKPIYQKTINCGTLPNNTYKDIPSGLSNITIINMYGMSKATNDGAMIPIPRTNIGSANTDVDISYRNDNKIRLITQMDLSVFDWTYVTLQYIKTTD